MMGSSAQKKKKTLPSPQPHQQPKGNNSNGKPTYSSSSSPPASAYNPNVTAETSPYAYLYPGAGSTEKKAQPYDEVTSRSSKPFDTRCISLVMSGKNILATKPRPGQKSKAVCGKPPVTIGPPKDASIVVCAGAKVSKPSVQRQKQPEQQRRQQQPRPVLSTGHRGTARPPMAMSNADHRPSQKPSCSAGAASLPTAQINPSTRSATPDSTRKQHQPSPWQKAVSNKRSRQASAVAEDDDSESEQDVRSASKRRRFARRYSDKEADTIIASVEDDEPTSSTSSTTTTSPAKQQSPATDKKSTTGKTTPPPPPCKGVAVYVSGHRSSRAASKGSSSPKSNFFHKGERLASNPFIKA